MHKLVLVAATAAAILIPGSLASSGSADAHGWGHYKIVRWSTGDCRIWVNWGNEPFGNYTVLRWKHRGHYHTWVRGYDRAWRLLQSFRSKGRCL